MRRYKKLPKLIMAESAQVAVMCPECKFTSSYEWTELSTEHSGGCGGHDNESYCYCEPNQLTVSVACKSCKNTVHILHESSFTY